MTKNIRMLAVLMLTASLFAPVRTEAAVSQLNPAYVEYMNENKTAEIGAAFGMEIVYTNRSPKMSDSPLLKNARQLPLENLLACADFVSLNVPQNEATARMVNSDFIGKMKPGAKLINTGRGGLIDETAVAEALRDGRLSGYAADVLSAEPPTPDNPLLSAPNTLITPHIAWQSTEARQRLMDIAVANVKAFLSGQPQNRVN